LIGWRGEPGKHDEPQHIKQGEITVGLLDTLGIPYRILADNEAEALTCVEEVTSIIESGNRPGALIVRSGTFKPYKMQGSNTQSFELTREAAIRAVAERLDESDIVVSTTGKISRELYEYRDSTGGDHRRDFLTVGSMGHCCQIALGIALAKPDRQVYCFDGDGSVIMHMGAMAITGSTKPTNLKHIVFNNGCHDSVGGQPSCGFDISIPGIARSCGYELAMEARTLEQIHQSLAIIKSTKAPVLLEIKVDKGAREDLGRPKTSPLENKQEFMQFLRT